MQKLGSMKQRTITLHKLVRLKFERFKTVVAGIDHQWQSDVCDIQNQQAESDSYKYLLASIDVFSRFAIVLPLKNKNAMTVKTLMKSSFKTENQEWCKLTMSLNILTTGCGNGSLETT